jgi:hypothetical protein
MAAENLADVISTLTPEQQESVRQFVPFLKRQGETEEMGMVDAQGLPLPADEKRDAVASSLRTLFSK